MKRRILCVASFFLILLVFLTLISPKAEEEMRTLVDARTTGRGYGNVIIGNIAVEWKSSNNRLFSVVDGRGWDSGERLSEIPSDYFDCYPAHVEMGRGTEYRYVYSASREPSLGDAVRMIQTRFGMDTYLLWSPEPFSILSLGFLPRSMGIEAIGENVALLDCRNATFPFFEHSVWFTLQGLPNAEWQETRNDLRVYSMHDVHALTRALPWIAGVLTALLGCLILCAASWCLFGRSVWSRRLLLINLLLIVLLMAVVPILLMQFDLPASLMPEESILDIQHYVEDFARIHDAMDSMNDTRVREWQSRAMLESAAVAGLGVAAIVALVAVEGSLCRRRGVASVCAAD